MPSDATDPTREYTVERHREYHAQAVGAWRDRLRDETRERAIIETPRSHVEVEIHIPG